MRVLSLNLMCFVSAEGVFLEKTDLSGKGPSDLVRARPNRTLKDRKASETKLRPARGLNKMEGQFVAFMAVEGVDKEGRSHDDQASPTGMNERQCFSGAE